MKQLQEEILEWSNNKFNEGRFTPNRAIPISYHLQKESLELTESLEEYFSKIQTPQSLDKVEKEIADIFILALEVASHVGMDINDITLACRDKFEICKKRKWGTPDENGVVEHLK